MPPRLTAPKLEAKGRVKGSEFARLAGVSRQNINNLKNDGVVVQDEDGLYDLSNPANMLYLHNPRNRSAKSEAQTQRNDPEYAEVRGTKDLLDRQKLEQQIVALEIKNQEKRNELIPRSLVANVFSKLHAIDQSQFGGLGQNLAPTIMAIGGILDETKEMEIQAEIDRQVWAVLANAKRIADEFLKSLKEEADEMD